MNDVSEDGYIDVVLPRNLVTRMHYVGPDAIIVYAYIYSRINLREYWNHDVKEAWPGVEDIAEHTCICRQRVMRATEKLEYLGYISIGRQHKKVNHYFFLPGIEKDQDFMIRYFKYSEKEEKRMHLSPTGWPIRRPHSPKTGTPQGL